MSSDDIARVLEEAEEWLLPSSDVGTTDPDAWGSYEDVIRGLAAIVREQQERIAELTSQRDARLDPQCEASLKAILTGAKRWAFARRALLCLARPAPPVEVGK